MESVPDQGMLLGQIKKLSGQIASQQRKLDSGEYNTYGAALGLQDLKRKRQTLMGDLERPKLVVVNEAGPCVKQTVTATIITTDGERFVGTNDCLNPQTVCPRAGMPTGVGYELCQTVCRQTAHAEVNAINKARSRAKGGVLYLEGHTYACEPCKQACADAGIAEIIIGPPPQP